MLAEYVRAGLVCANPFAGQKLRRIPIKPYSPLRGDALPSLWREAVKLRDGDLTATPTAPRIKNTPRKRWSNHDFRKPHKAAYVLLLLELGLGLRRHEADKAQWDWFHSDAEGRHFIEVKETPFFQPKSKERRVIPVEKTLFDAIHHSRDEVTPFIVPGRVPRKYEAGKTPKNLVYRCDLHHRVLAMWLRRQGIADGKPCHLLRKEFGSYVATTFGLFTAQRYLGHSSPVVTDAHYAGLTAMPELAHAKIK